MFRRDTPQKTLFAVQEEMAGPRKQKLKKNTRAIDLYSGIGGWSLGLSMAGIDVVASYEWWDKAAVTNKMNNGHTTTDLDIRALSLDDLPKDIQIVVGSPPCTQFSFANRGGNGDIEDGLKDIEKFLTIVEHVNPVFWAMENVPRTAEILRARLQPGGSLERFAHLNPVITIVDMAEWGVPQRRRRCIVGNFDSGLLLDYTKRLEERTLSNVVKALNGSTIIDPIYDISIPVNKLTDHQMEEHLAPEEERLNREAKTFHPIYNKMSFPDDLDRPSRTITATCTRVSRESVVIERLDEPLKYRRLSVRERGCLQGFPITYQFYGESYAQKLKMIGNAVPPLFTFYVAQAMRGISPKELITPAEGIQVFTPPERKTTVTIPDSAGESFPPNRRFRAAIPHLRFGSGVRFELVNAQCDGETRWQVRFFYGDSKNIHELPLNEQVFTQLINSNDLADFRVRVLEIVNTLQTALNTTNAINLQNVWAHVTNEGTHPFVLVDALGHAADKLNSVLSANLFKTVTALEGIFAKLPSTKGRQKIFKYSLEILSGVIVGSYTNIWFESDRFRQSYPKARSMPAAQSPHRR